MIAKIFNNFLAGALLYKKQTKKTTFFKKIRCFFVISFPLTKLLFGVPVEHSLLQTSDNLERNRVRNSYKN